MLPYPSYQLYQAERSPSAAERRQAEMRLGQAAARTSQVRGRVGRIARLRPLRLQARRPAGAARPC